MTITIDNRDTENITIDTYQMFTGDSFVESEIESMIYQTGDQSLDYDSFEWKFDHPAIVESLAAHSVGIIEDAIRFTEYADIIKCIALEKTASPQWYNYTTDSYKMTVDYDAVNLAQYLDKNRAAIVEIAKACQAYELDITDNDMQYAAIVHILQNCITADDYNMAMWDIEGEVYANNCKVTKVNHG